MRTLLFSLAWAALPLLGAAPPRTPEQVVEAQISAFNAHDLEAFVGLHAEDVACFTFPAAEPDLRGREALRGRYAQRFKEGPELHVNVKAQMVHGAKVIQKERLTGRGAGKAALEVVVVYEVEGARIKRVWVLP